MYLPDLRDKQGFTLIELMISIAILGILTATTLPLANAYRLRAEYLCVMTTLRYLMDGIETHYIDTNELYPEVTLTSLLPSFECGDEELIVNEGEQKAITELSYTFQQGHKHKYTFSRNKIRIKFGFFNIDWDQAEIIVETDFDYDRDGTNDTYTAYMCLDHDQPVDGLYRKIL